jgi:hypothetical protein
MNDDSDKLHFLRELAEIENMYPGPEREEKASELLHFTFTSGIQFPAAFWVELTERLRAIPMGRIH